jgi:hypothetical protein
MRTYGAFGILVMTAVLSACTSTRLVVPGSKGDIEIPANVVHDLDTVWKGAHLATAGASCPGTPGPAPAAMTADLNGDDMPDLIIRAEKDGTSRFYAALARKAGEHNLWAVTGEDAPAPAGALTVAPRGTPFYREGSGFQEYLGVDTPVLHACDGSRIAYLWHGNGFDPSRLTDAPAGPPLVLPTAETETK